MTTAQIYSKLKEFAQLQHGWDSTGSFPIDKDILAIAHNIAEPLINQTGLEWNVYPVSSGTVQFETKDSAYNIEVCMNKRLCLSKKEDCWAWTLLTNNIKEITDYINKEAENVEKIL